GENVILYRNSTLVPSRLLWRDREGKETGTVGEPAYYRWPRLSPDGRSITVVRLDPRTQGGDVWLYGTGPEPATRLTSIASGVRGAAVWPTDGHRIADTLGRDTHGH